MKKELKDLQEKYSKGEIKKSKYLVEVEKLVEAETLTQDEADEAEEFDPEADKPIYTQADYDTTIAKKATQQIRKILKEAGVEVDASNKDLSGKVVELVKIGAGKMEAPKTTDPEVAAAAAKNVTRMETLTAEIKGLRAENAVLKTIGKYNPISNGPILALMKSDYAHLIEYADEETGLIDTKSLDRIFKRLQLDEPTLFKTDEGDKGGQSKGSDGFRGKGPGGNGGSGAGDDKGHDAKLASAKEMMGIKSTTTK